MNSGKSFCHSVWDCKYHIVWIPKCRRKVLYGRIPQQLGEVIRELARKREGLVGRGSLFRSCPCVYRDPPKYAVAQAVGYIKRKSAIHIARTFSGRSRSFTGGNFWARGYFASTVGRDEEVIRNYIRSQEHEDRRVDQLKLLS